MLIQLKLIFIYRLDRDNLYKKRIAKESLLVISVLTLNCFVDHLNLDVDPQIAKFFLWTPRNILPVLKIGMNLDEKGDQFLKNTLEWRKG